ncbi:T9SS type B sorting domain-containing protein [Tenacibaculum sp.]|uniref:T9SS type B sorting domain-containing protein n=1 Tax=Tenacibaculum sp. TaxID=1906242 RepID=UPI003D0BA323
MKKIITLLLIVLQTFFSFSQEKPKSVSKPIKKEINETDGYKNLLEILSQENMLKPVSAAGFSQRVINPDGSSGGINIKGDITFIANNVLSVDDSSHDPEDPYDGSESNGSVNMQYIDIDGDASTFSSSSAELNLPTCSRVVYAGLYWAGVYQTEDWSDKKYARTGDPTEIKFKLPGGAYQDIKADVNNTTSRELIYDNNIAYICYKDITIDIQDLATTNPNGHNGTYVGANIRATRGDDPNGLGGSGGWTMVIIYENQTKSSKNISIFDGFADVYYGNDVSLSYSGFTTVPVGNPANPAPVRATLLAAALEGDRSIRGDSFQFIDTNGNPVDQYSTNVNRRQWEYDYTINSWGWRYNFFDGSISVDDQHVTSRTPDSENTLGFDVDLYQLSNPNNSVITNGQTSATVNFTSSQDKYWPFLNALAVEIIEPELQMVKSVVDSSGNDVQGTPVTLGSELWYDISFQNVGTDDATNTIITDRLPKNVDLLETVTGGTVYNGTRFDIDLPAGVTINDYEAPSVANGFRAEVEFAIPDSMVLEGGAKYNIRLHVQVVSDCNQLRDVCSNLIQNQAFARYDGVRGGSSIDNEPSYSGFDDCDFGIVGSSNFLVDIDACDFRRTEVLCDGSLQLTAGDGFDTYRWEDEDGKYIDNTQSITVTSGGTYTVTKTTTLGCLTKPEIIEVISIADAPNPLESPFADRFNTACVGNETELAEVYLCGDGNSTRDITLPFAGTTTKAEWFKLNGDGGCGYDYETNNCAPTDTGCSWTSLGTDLTQSFSDTGAYKLEVLYDDSCLRTYYFNVFKNTLSPTIMSKDIICGTDGSIVINSVPNGYEYSLSGNGTTTPFQTSNSFAITQPGTYTVTIRLAGSSDTACSYVTENISIQELDINLNVLTNIDACGGLSELVVQIENVPGGYSYEIRKDNVYMTGSNGYIDSNDQRYTITESGTYQILVTTEDGCSENETRVITIPDPVTLSAVTTKNITCKDGSSPGIITLTPGGGTAPYEFAVISINGTPVADADKVYFTDTTYEVTMGNEGTYVFELRDANNCTTTAEATVVVEPELVFTATPTQVLCNGDTSGSITVNLTSGSTSGYTLAYSIDGLSTTNNTGLFTGLAAGDYTIDIVASASTYQCAYQLTTTITEPPALTAEVVKERDYNCGAGGKVRFFNETGGTGAYEYGFGVVDSSGNVTSITYYSFDDNGSAEAVFNSLTPGFYRFYIRDENNCVYEIPGDIEIFDSPNAPQLVPTITYNCDGTGNVVLGPPSEIKNNFEYSLDDGPTTNINNFPNLVPGPHKILVYYKGQDCSTLVNFVIEENQAFTGSIVGSTDSECYGSDNGTVTISASNVIGGSFEYSTDGGTTWSMTADNPYRVVGLAAGTYNIFIRETANGQTCPIDLGNVVINQPEELTLSASATQEVTCNTATGTITASATGGIPPYTFSIDGGATWQSSPVFSNVPPRATDYIVMVRDSRSCNECGCTANLFENGGFELPANSATTYQQMNEDLVPGWDSTASDNLIEIWYNGFNGVSAHEGNAFAELNANTVSSLYQEYCTQPGDVINWSVAHRGRSGVDEATVKIGSDLATALVVETMSDGTSAWGVYSGTYTVPVGQSTTVIAFDALSTAGGNNTVGNFIDDVQININRTNCVPVSVPIIEPTSLDFTVTPVTCYDGSNGTLTVNVTSGNDDYQFSLDGGTTWQTPNAATPTEYIFVGLTDGTYDITVQDGKGCSDTQQGTILPQVTATIVPVSASCNDGQIQITPSGGDGNFVFVVDNGGTQTTYNSSPITVPAGTYTVYIRDKNGGANYCEYSETVTVNQIIDPTITASAVQPKCSGETGTINATVANGAPPYNVTVTGPTTPAAQTGLTLNYSFIGLSAGNYTVTVTDANGCSSSTTETITVPTALTGGSAAATDLMCSTTGTVLGTITFTAPTGGTPNYLYFYKLTSDTNYTQAGSTTVTNLDPGTYDTRVVDANGCILDLNQVTIADLPTEPTLASSIAYNCDGTGNIDVVVTPLDPSYIYTLDGGAPQTGNNVFTNIAVGPHTISVEYGSSCTTDITVNVEPDQEFTAAIIGNSKTCIGSNDGTITVETYFPSSAPTSFEYNANGSGWQAAGTNPFTITGLPVGLNTIEVRPNSVSPAACVVTLQETLVDPTPIVVTAPITKEITCNPATGATITPDATGGNGAVYTYELFDATNTSVSTTNPFTNIPAGSYTVVATDRLGCTGSVAVTVNPIVTVTFDAVPQCYDGTNGQIDVTVNSGNGDYTFSLNGTTWQTPTPLTSNTYTFSGLSSGNYTVYVQDGRGCTENMVVTINPQLFATATPTNASCNPTGEILINPTGGTGAGTYEFAVISDGSPAPTATDYSATNPVTGLAADTYDVYVRDDAGCEYVIQNIVIASVPPLEITATANQPTCNGDTGSIDVAIVANTGEAPYTITISDSGGGYTNTINNFVGSSISFDNLAVETYTITITDALGCVDTETATLTNPPALVMDIEEVLAPNCGNDPLLTGFNFININPADYLPNTLQYSIDNGVTWVDFTTTNGQIRNLNSGDVVHPVLRTIDGSGTTLCLIAYGPYEIPYNVTGLIVNPIIDTGDCTAGLTVTVEAINGSPAFMFAINSPASGWFPADALNNGTLNDPDRTRTFTGLTPGVDYDFFVMDGNGCIEMNNENIYADFTPTVLITGTVNNQACFGANSGQITYSINDVSGDLSNDFTWTLYKRDANNEGVAVAGYTNIAQTGDSDIVVTGLAPGTYYIVLSNTGGVACEFGAQDVEVIEGTEISGQVTKVRDITCSVDGLVRIENVVGGFPGYTYTFNVTNGTGVLSGNTITVAASTVTGSPVTVEAFAEDTNGCGPVSLGTVALTLSPSPNIVSAIPASCDVNKTITINVNNGTAPYSYSIDGGTTFISTTTSTTYVAEGLTPGSYDIVVRDNNGCTDTATGIIVNPDIDFNLSISQNATCVPGNDGEVLLNITSGTGGNYNYSFDTGAAGTINSPGTSVTVGSLAPGVHNVTVTDVTSGCSVIKSITVQDPVNPSFTYIAENSLCSGDNSGTITLTAIDNGILPVTYTISPVAGTYDGDSTFTNLPPGTYTVTGTAANGCTTPVSNIVIDEYAPIAASTPIVTEFACTTGNTVNVATVELPTGTAGGSGTYTRVVFTYDPADGSADETLDSNSFTFTTSNTAGGTVNIDVYDDKGCLGTTSATIAPFDALSNPIVTLDTAITCSAGADITVTYTSTLASATNITIEGINGNAYAAVTQNGVTAGDFDNLPTGDYQITIANPTTGCELVTYYTVDEEPVFDLLITDVMNESCRENDDASVLMSFSSSTPYLGQYDYVVYDASDDSIYRTVTGQTGDSPIANLDANPGTSRTYYVIVTMTNTPNCQARTPNFTVYQPAQSLLVSAVVAPLVSCTNASDATITATATGGWGNYEYQLEDLVGTVLVTYNASNIFTGIASGDYRVRVRDGNGCPRSTTVTVANPTPVTFSVIENDNVCDTSVGGSITVNAAGGTGTYTYTLSNAGGVVETQILNATTYTFTNLSADDYTVNVVDSNGCDAGTPTDVTINPDVNFSLVETKKVDCSASPDGIVTVDLVNWTSGTSTYQYDVVGSVDGVLVTGGTVTSDPFTITIPSTYTTPQTYTVSVRDLDATPVCDVSRDIVIQPEIRPVFTAIATVNNICNGSSDGVIQLNATDNGIVPLTYSITSAPAGAAAGATFNATNQTYENLVAATYTITAQGTNGCTTDVSVTIDENPVIDISNAITVTQFACTTGNTVDTAIIVVDKGAITGGTGKYVRVVFEDSTGNVLQDDSNFTYISTDLAGGDYTVKVYDENTDCFVSRVVTINPFTPMTDATITVNKAIDCSTGENITVKVNPDIANAVYTITGATTGTTSTQTVAVATDSAVFTNLPADNYTIEILNPVTGCILKAYHTVDPAPVFDILVTNIQRACFGGTGGVDISFDPVNPYTDIYNYEVFTLAGVSVGTGSGTGGTPTTITGLVPGEYYVVVTMPNTPFCTVQTVNFEIAQPDNDLTLSSQLTYLKCTPANSGAVNLTANGGWSGYQYELVNNTTGTTVQSFNNNAIITGLVAGDYTATVRDINGCIETTTFSLTPGITITGNYQVTPNVCEGEYSATIEAIGVAGGQTQDPNLAYTYILEYPNGTRTASQSSPIFANLPAGNGYSIIVADGYSCDGLIGPIDIVDPIKVAASAEIIGDITCNDPQAAVEVTGAGGAGPYTFSMDGITYTTTPAASYTFNVDAGTYLFYARDTELCVSEPTTVTVGAYVPLVATLNTESAFITCNGDSNAVLSAEVQGGFANYEYQLLDGNDTPIDGTWQASNIFSGLDVGTYKISVRSTNRFGVVCTAVTGAYTITEPLPLQADVIPTAVTCFGGNDGTITVNAQGGNNDYEFNIVSDPSSPEFPETKFVKNNVFENLSAGVYWITVKDVVGCILAPIRVEVTQPEEFTAALTGVNEQTCIYNPTPTITLDVQGGTQPYYVSINNVELSTPYTSNTIVLGAGENIQGGTFYYITVRDEAGCNPAAPITLTTAEPVDLQLTVDLEYTCPTGNVIMAIVDEAYRNDVSYTLYDGNGSPVTTNATGEFIDVPAGNGYTVTATHTITSCSESSTSSPISVVDYQPLTMTIDDSVKNTLIANADFGLPPYEYSVDGGAFGPDNEFLILQTKDYTITVRDARGCEVTLTVRGEYISIFVPNLFTPDGDGINDYWYPREVEDYHEIRVYIYDRYARNIADFKGVIEGWDGTYEGTPLPSGDYWYTINFKELSGQEKKIMGHFTLYR